jgi:DNA-directed RNA polymerase subunit RPC12/RpoP
VIKPINISPLNTSNMLWYRCKNCSATGVISLKDKIIHLDSKEDSTEELNYDCPKCMARL